MIKFEFQEIETMRRWEAGGRLFSNVDRYSNLDNYYRNYINLYDALEKFIPSRFAIENLMCLISNSRGAGLWLETLYTFLFFSENIDIAIPTLMTPRSKMLINGGDLQGWITEPALQAWNEYVNTSHECSVNAAFDYLIQMGKLMNISEKIDIFNLQTEPIDWRPLNLLPEDAHEF